MDFSLCGCFQFMSASTFLITQSDSFDVNNCPVNIFIDSLFSKLIVEKKDLLTSICWGGRRNERIRI